MPAPPVFYLIPGLGADERVFQFLRLPGEVHVLHWLPPQTATEPLPHYAARLAAAVPPGQPCWLVGVSFGGVLALEVAQLRPLARVVLISSFAGPSELPWAGRLARATGLYRLLPPQLLPHLPTLANWFFGVKSTRDRQLFRQILRDTDPEFTRWAIARLLQWPGRPQTPTLRIHGTTDRLLPHGAIHSHHQLPGGHLIIISRAAEISRILTALVGASAAGAANEGTSSYVCGGIPLGHAEVRHWSLRPFSMPAPVGSPAREPGQFSGRRRPDE